MSSRIESSFANQAIMATLGATLERVAPGEVDIALAVRPELCQQHGYLHAGVLATSADSACGYAALTLMPDDAAVLSVEFKINLLRPASGDRVVARARVIKPGRTLAVCRADVFAFIARSDGAGDPDETLVATMTGTMMTVRGRGIAD